MPAEIEKDLDGSIPISVEELEGKRLMPIEMTGFPEGKYRCQFPTADVHIERFGTDVEEAIGIGEFSELTKDFDGRGSVRDDDMYIARASNVRMIPSQREKSSSRASSPSNARMISTSETRNLWASIRVV